MQPSSDLFTSDRASLVEAIKVGFLFVCITVQRVDIFASVELDRHRSRLLPEVRRFRVHTLVAPYLVPGKSVPGESTMWWTGYKPELPVNWTGFNKEPMNPALLCAVFAQLLTSVIIDLDLISNNICLKLNLATLILKGQLNHFAFCGSLITWLGKAFILRTQSSIWVWTKFRWLII